MNWEARIYSYTISLTILYEGFYLGKGPCLPGLVGHRCVLHGKWILLPFGYCSIAINVFNSEEKGENYA